MAFQEGSERSPCLDAASVFKMAKHHLQAEAVVFCSVIHLTGNLDGPYFQFLCVGSINAFGSFLKEKLNLEIPSFLPGGDTQQVSTVSQALC